MNYNFSPRLVAPYNTNPNEVPLWFANPRNGYYPDNQMPNCTCYAFGRVMEIGNENGLKIISDGILGPANLWGEINYIGQFWKKGKQAKLGAIAVWDENGFSGHVAIVEQINENGTYVCSNSGYYRPVDINDWHYFFLTTCDVNNTIYYKGSVWKQYTFKYFIYPPYIQDDPITPKSSKNKRFPWVIYLRKNR